jgi:hypothetical protein
MVAPATEVPVNVFTITVTVEVVVPLAGIVEGAAMTVTMLGTAVWLIWVIELLPDCASVAVIVQGPGVREAT